MRSYVLIILFFILSACGKATDPLIGSWTVAIGAADSTTFQFGEKTFNVTYKTSGSSLTDKGSYTVSGSTMTLTYDDSSLGVKTYTYSVNAKELSLTDSSSSTIKYTKD